MSFDNIINRIKKVFKKEKQQTGWKSRKLYFEHLENKEMLSVVSFGSIPSLSLIEGSALYENGGDGCCSSGCCDSSCCDSSCCSSSCCSSSCCSSSCCSSSCNIGTSGCFAVTGFERIPVTVTPDPEDPPWLPGCFDIGFEMIPDNTPLTSGDLQFSVSYTYGGLQYQELLPWYTFNGKKYFDMKDYNPSMSNIELEVTAINDYTPEPDQTFTIKIREASLYDSGCYGSYPRYSISGNNEVTVIVQDDDNWAISSIATDEIALEPCIWIPAADRTGAFELTKSGGLDNGYDIIVEFELGGTATPRSNVPLADAPGSDYHLTYSSIGTYAGLMLGLVYDEESGVWKGSTVISSGSDSVTLYVMPDGDHIFEDDETVTLTVTKSYASGMNGNVAANCFTIGETGGVVTIYQAPEFLSDADINYYGSGTLPVNHDSYRSYISHKAVADTAITTRTVINAQKNRNVNYTIISGNSDGIFEINESTGVITTVVALADMELQELYPLKIRVYDTAYEQLYDEADVSVVISEWKVNRNGNAKAPALAYGGCTVAELANEIGLQADEFKKWLTFTTSTVTLFNGQTKTLNQLSQNDVIWGVTSTQNYAAFQIPNTIHCGWFGDYLGVGQYVVSWSKNIEYLQNLGFYVLVHNNDAFPQGGTNAVNAYKNGLQQLWASKSLHGMYVMGHGNNDAFGSRGNDFLLDFIEGRGDTTTVYYSELNAMLTQYGYHLGAVVIEACFSNAASSLVSENGIFYGTTGVYIPLFQSLLARRWGSEYDEFTPEEVDYYYAIYGEYPFGMEWIGGLQRTKVFSYVVW